MKYKNPGLTIDIAVFSYNKEDKKIYISLVKRPNDLEEANKNALVGTFVGYNEMIDEAINRVLKNKANINLSSTYHSITKNGYSDELDRDNRGRIISLLFSLFVPHSVIKDSSLYSFPINDYPQNLAFNHDELIEKLYNKITVKDKDYLFMLGEEFYLADARNLTYLLTKNESIKDNSSNYLITYGKEKIENTRVKKKLTSYDNKNFVYKLI